MYSALLALSLAPAPDTLDSHRFARGGCAGLTARAGCHGQVARAGAGCVGQVQRAGCLGSVQIARQRVVTRSRTVAYVAPVPAPVAKVAPPEVFPLPVPAVAPLPMTPANVGGWPTIYPRTSKVAPLYRATNATLDVLGVFRVRGGCLFGGCPR